jgi:hypothetical protein
MILQKVLWSLILIESSYNPWDVVVIVSDCTVSDCTVVVLFSGSVGDVSDIAEDFVSDSGSDFSDSAVIVVVSDWDATVSEYGKVLWSPFQILVPLTLQGVF